jgi:hypothetical protein
MVASFLALVVGVRPWRLAEPAAVLEFEPAASSRELAPTAAA